MSENKDTPQQPPQPKQADKDTTAPAKGKPRGGGGRRRRPPPQSSGGQPAAPAPSPAAGRSGYAGPVAIIALLVGVGALVGGYFIWHEVNRQARWQQEVLAQIDNRNQAMDSRIETAVTNMEDEVDAAVRARRTLRRELEDQSQSIASLEKAFGVLRAQVGRSQEAWVLAEAEYLLHVANQRLQLVRDIDTAIAALTSADQRLQELANPAYLPVREAVSRERSALRAINPPDIEGITLQLQTLTENIGQLKVAGAEYTPPELGGGDAAAPAESSRPEGWRDLPETMWNELRKLVVVRRNDEPVAPMLAPEQQFFLYANLRLQLDTARLAALRQTPAVYRSGLQTARDWLREEFDTEQPAVQESLNSIDQLLQVNLRPELPDISESLRLLRQEMALKDMDRNARAQTRPASGTEAEAASTATEATPAGSAEDASGTNNTEAEPAP